MINHVITNGCIKNKTIFIIGLCFLFDLLASNPVLANANAVVCGHIYDIMGKPLSGAEVYGFQSPDVKRPADFISTRTGSHGSFCLTVPEGKYWLVAIYRKSGNKFGPLAIEDKHSGEALTLKLKPGEELIVDFEVFDLRDAARKYSKKNSDLVKISGRIIDNKGDPLVDYYVVADKNKQPAQLPLYLSAWTGKDGQYVLFLPLGQYYLAALRGFPPEDLIFDQNAVVEGELNDFDIVVQKSQ